MDTDKDGKVDANSANFHEFFRMDWDEDSPFGADSDKAMAEGAGCPLLSA
jgi:hypothetical protein